MGLLHGGWTIATRLLQFERENISATASPTNVVAQRVLGLPDPR